MRRWVGSCWLGSKSGYVDITVSANTITGAKEQLQNIYGAEQILNLREVRSSSSSSSSSGSVWLIGLLGAGGLFLYFTPWVLMLLYGAGATWITEKFTGMSMEEYADTDDEETTDNDHMKALATVGAAIIFGGIGFIHGTSLNNDFNRQYNLDGNQTKVEEVRQK